MAPSPSGDRDDVWRGVDRAWVMTVELLAATFVWGGIGWLLDRYVFGSGPWGMVAGFVLGFALGMYLLYVRMQRAWQAEDERREARRAG